ncbi:type I polyketide synthase, partial [Paenibacillus sp. GbtcB18]|uniref:type I polyketide synthase n=1 Tax=Paenibacillus sp. GbtcB18 TaxID=2824763 RepID=UPI001C3091EF
TFSVSEGAPIGSKPENEILAKPMEKHHLYLNEEVRSDDEPIAIVGISGKFPMADDVEEFWENLMNGKDCISEIPSERWDWKDYYGNPKNEKNKTNIKWGGFINGIDEFDPLFFGISPREAELMDPQQRLLLTYAWKVMEDAGYSAKSLSGTNTGVFIGTARSGYESFLTHKNSVIEGFSATGMTPSIGPNRLSYFLNIHGPSEAIETACSSSLVAIHRAVSSIKDGSCEMAFVGGINTIISPQVHISFNKAGMLSEDGRCKTFSDKANGYVRSEAVGMLFLKKLKDAERDGNQIYGVILSSSVNHGGRSNSLSAPNPAAQTELLKNVYRKANVNPSTITYIETHGTGTELGDPIEINSLKAAFQDLFTGYEGQTIENAQCGLGSVKTNVGHSELAAGIVGTIKVLLQLKYKTIVKSLHCETTNPYIQLQGTHFYINKETKKWDRLMDRDGKEIPRRAGISSFGFGGVNAHIVLEEYTPKIAVPLLDIHAAQIPKVLLMSAKSEDRLCEQAKHLLKWIQEGRFSEDDLASIAYTLQVGREAMDERLAFVAKNLKELEERLIDIIEGRFYDIYRDEVKKNKAFSTFFKDDGDLNKVIELWLTEMKYDNLINLWVKGVAIDWERLYRNKHHQIISLPSYPFYRDRYWLSVNEEQSQTIVNESQQLTTLHPVLHSNNSNFMEQRFTSTFTG